ncbi:MAG: hypothetical protein AB1758_19905 [Candidatus Eremiobacterota bacterium]
MSHPTMLDEIFEEMEADLSDVFQFLGLAACRRNDRILFASW